MHPELLVFGETHFFSGRWVEPASDGRYSSDQLETIWSNLSDCPFWSSVHTDADRLNQEPGWLTKTSRGDIPEVIELARSLIGPNPTPEEVLDALGRAFCIREGKSFWMEKTADEGKTVAHTIRAAPEAQFLLIMRDPIGFIRSYKYQGAQFNSEVSTFFQKRYHPILAALIWRKTYRSLRWLRKTHPDQCSLHVPTTTEERLSTLTTACKLCGLEPTQEMKDSIGTEVNSSKISGLDRKLSRHDIAWARALCRVQDPRLGISDDHPKTGLLDLIRSIPSIFAWVIPFVFKYRNTQGFVNRYRVEHGE